MKAVIEIGFLGERNRNAMVVITVLPTLTKIDIDNIQTIHVIFAKLATLVVRSLLKGSL